MAKVSYANLKLKVNSDVTTFEYLNNTFEILKYLPANDKYDLIMITLQKAQIDVGYYNPILLDIYFKLHLVYMYSNISFTEKQKEDEIKLYDTLKSNGLLDEIINHIDKEEYDYLWQKVVEFTDNEFTYNTTAASVIRSLIKDLPEQAAAAAKVIDEFDPEKYQAVIDFAKAANGGREI